MPRSVGFYESTFSRVQYADYRNSLLTVAVDFNGVVHDHAKGSKGLIEPWSPEIPGSIDWLSEVCEHFNVSLMSARFCAPGSIGPDSIQAAKRWLVAKGIPASWISHDPETIPRRIHLTGLKSKYAVLVDDRAVTFTGKFPSVDFLHNFKPWNR